LGDDSSLIDRNDGVGRHFVLGAVNQLGRLPGE
jgi:hypothetical protein